MKTQAHMIAAFCLLTACIDGDKPLVSDDTDADADTEVTPDNMGSVTIRSIRLTETNDVVGETTWGEGNSDICIEIDQIASEANSTVLNAQTGVDSEAVLPSVFSSGDIPVTVEHCAFNDTIVFELWDDDSILDDYMDSVTGTPSDDLDELPVTVTVSDDSTSMVLMLSWNLEVDPDTEDPTDDIENV